MRRLLLTATTLVALAAMASPAAAQLKIGVHGATITSLGEVTNNTETFDLSGDFGLGGKLMFDFPMLPIALIAGGEYYFPDCGTVDCSYYSALVGANLYLPLPVIKPYLTGGLQYRKLDLNVAGTEGDSGAVVGLGVQLDFMISVYLEGMFEFYSDDPMVPDFDNDPITIKGGILIG